MCRNIPTEIPLDVCVFTPSFMGVINAIGYKIVYRFSDIDFLLAKAAPNTHCCLHCLMSLSIIDIGRVKTPHI